MGLNSHLERRVRDLIGLNRKSPYSYFLAEMMCA